MIDSLISADNELMLLLNGMHNDFFDTFMSIFSGRFTWIPMYVALAYVIVARYKARTAVVAMICVGLTILLADQICASVIRPEIARLRPSNLDNPLSAYIHIVNGYRGGPYGFPSCHAANSFALAFLSSLLVRRRAFTLLIFLWAFLNSYSRIYLGVHYPGDIIVGALIGCLCALTVYVPAKALFPRLGAQLFPDRYSLCISLRGRDRSLCLSPLAVMAIVAIITIIYIFLASVA